MEESENISENENTKHCEFETIHYLKEKQLENDDDFEILMEKNKKCTYFLTGDEPIKQSMYICRKCDFFEPSPMCESCYKNCHEDCHNLENLHLNSPDVYRKRTTNHLLTGKFITHKMTGELSMVLEQLKTANKGKHVFSCLCGKKHNHRIIEARIDENKNEKGKKCNLQKELLPSLNVFHNSFYCEDCKIKICNLCADSCHFFHNYRRETEDSDCRCNNSKHTLNNFLLKIFFNEKSSPVNYAALISSQTKILNMMFLRKELFGNLSDFLIQCLNPSSTKLNKVIDPTENLSDVLRKSFSKSSRNLLDFKFEVLSGIQKRPEGKEKNNYIELHHIDGYNEPKLGDKKNFLDLTENFFQIIFHKNDKCYYYNEELRDTFSFQSTFRVIDNICDLPFNSNYSPAISNLIGILFYIHLKSDFQHVKNLTISDFMGSNIITRLKHKQQLMNIKNINVNDFIMTSDSEYSPNLKFKKYINDLSPLSKISIKLSRLIKKCLHSVDINVKPTLYEVCLRFINFGLKKMYFTKIELKSLIDNLYEFIKEFFHMTIEKKKHDDLKPNLEVTKNIFYYLIKICYLIAVNYNDLVTQDLAEEFFTKKVSLDKQQNAYIHANEEYGDKLLKMILKTVIIVSESYYFDLLLDKKIINICNESLKFFTVTDNFYLHQLNSLHDEDLFDINKISLINQENLSISVKLTNLIQKIFIGDYSDTLTGKDKVYLEIDIILKTILDTNINSALQNEEDISDEKESEKISDYKLKLFSFISQIMGYESKEEFYELYSDLLKSNKFINNLISGNFDETISKYFSLFELKVLDQKDINAAFSIYLLYCLDKRSLEHLCIGKNLSTITKLFSSSENVDLILGDENKIEFLYLLIKGIFTNNINISNHKCIYNITKLSEEKLSNVKKITFKAKQRLLKIFVYLKGTFEFEEFKRIQNLIFKKFINLLDTNLFKKYMKEYFDLNRVNLGKSEDKKSKESILIDEDKNMKIKNSNKIFHKPFLIKIDSQSTINNANETKFKSLALKFYFSLFHFLSIDTYYIFDDIPEDKEQLEGIINFIDLSYMQNILQKKFLPLNYRTRLLVFLRTFYFIDILDSRNRNIERSYITNKEMHKYHSEDNLDKKEIEMIDKKTNYVFKIITVMDIFVFELEKIDELFKKNKLEYEYVSDYLIQIVYSIKIISDFVYYQKSILDNINWYLYKIGKRFIKKAHIIKSILSNINKMKDLGEIHDSAAPIDKRMENANFDVFDRDQIYNLISDSLIDILKATDADKKFKLEKYLRVHDKKIQNDFTPLAVITQCGYDEFYTKNENINRMQTLKEKFGLIEDEQEEKDLGIENTSNSHKNLFRTLLQKVFKRPFIRIYDTCLFRVINTHKTKDDIVDYRKNLITYFINFISSDPENKKFFVHVSNKVYTEKITTTLFMIAVKLLYYDTKNTQGVFEILNQAYINPENSKPEEKSQDLCQRFYTSFVNKMQKVVVLNFSTSINFFMFNRYTEISDLNKLMIQFLQLLAEGFNRSFKSEIFELRLSTTESISMFDIIYNQFKTAYYLMDLQAKIENNNELSHYKLIVLFSNIVDFFKEYIDGTEDSVDADKIPKMMQNIFHDKIHKCLLIRIDEKCEGIRPEKIELCKKLLLRVKCQVMKLLISFLNFGIDEKDLKLLLKKLPMTRLFEEIQYNLYELIKTFQKKASRNKDKSSKDILNLFELKDQKFSEYLTSWYISEDNFRQSFELKLCTEIFIFLNILSDVYGIKIIEDNFTEEKFKKIPILKKRDNEVSENGEIISFSSPHAVMIYKFMKRIVKKVEVKIFEQNKVYKTFFLKPPIAFYLSHPTKKLFLKTVSRESRFSKLSSLIKQADYFMFEMVYFSHFNMVGRNINKYLVLNILEIVNYIFIVIHQIFLLIEFYVSTSLPQAQYTLIPNKYVITNNNFNLAYLQVGYITTVLLLWGFFQFPLKLFENAMSSTSSFLLNKEIEEKRQIIYKFNETSLDKGTFSHIKYLSNVNKQTSFWKILKVSILDCMFINRTVNTFFFTLIFIILYLTTKSALFIVFPVVFLINIIPILYGMFVALRTKWQQLFTMLVFEFLCIYFFMWIGFYFLDGFFNYTNIYLPGQGNSNTENLCTSAITCYLLMIDAGFRSGGGIGDTMPNASWQQSDSTYIIFFFFKVLFYIFIVLILSNSCFGIIIDAFSDLRDKTNAIEEDKANICYICQLSRDNSLNKNINFDLHINKEHNPWNYIYFITHLLLNDPNDFNKAEFHSWEKITKSIHDVGWIPGETEETSN